jgi:hypothetical protein
MRSGVRVSWAAFAVALFALLLALALLVVAIIQESWGSAAQYSLGSLAVLAVVMIGYAVGRPWVLLLPWAVVVAWAVAVTAFLAVSALIAPSSSELADAPYGLALLGTYALVVDILLAVGLAAALIRGRPARDQRPYPS